MKRKSELQQLTCNRKRAPGSREVIIKETARLVPSCKDQAHQQHFTIANEILITPCEEEYVCMPVCPRTSEPHLLFRNGCQSGRYKSQSHLPNFIHQWYDASSSSWSLVLMFGTSLSRPLMKASSVLALPYLPNLLSSYKFNHVCENISSTLHCLEFASKIWLGWFS